MCKLNNQMINLFKFLPWLNLNKHFDQNKAMACADISPKGTRNMKNVDEDTLQNKLKYDGRLQFMSTTMNCNEQRICTNM